MELFGRFVDQIQDAIHFGEIPGNLPCHTVADGRGGYVEDRCEVCLVDVKLC